MQAVVRRDAGVQVAFTRGGSSVECQADRVVCAVPAAVLGRVEFDPPLSSEKRRAIARLSYTPAARVFVQCRTRVWETSPTAGFGVLNRSAEFWPSTFNQPGTRAVLQTYLRGDAAGRLSGVPEQRRVEGALDELEAAYTGLRAAFERGATKSWGEDEWARCAWAHPDEASLPDLQRPDGAIHFAGEHTSHWPSWMQGALESGARVAREIHADAKPPLVPRP